MFSAHRLQSGHFSLSFSPPRSHHQLFILPSTSFSCHRQLPAAILNTTSHMPHRPVCWNAPFTRCVRYTSHLFAVERQVFRDPSVFSDVLHEITAFPHSAQSFSRHLQQKQLLKPQKAFCYFFNTRRMSEIAVKNNFLVSRLLYDRVRFDESRAELLSLGW